MWGLHGDNGKENGNYHDGVIWGLGLGVGGLGFKVQGLGLKLYGVGFNIHTIKVYGLGLRNANGMKMWGNMRLEFGFPTPSFLPEP